MGADQELLQDVDELPRDKKSSKFAEEAKRDPMISARTGQPKRKKASRACFHCQKAHLTCDDARPCGRCIKRGLSTTCTDGVKKKAKYMDETSSESIPVNYAPDAAASVNSLQQILDMSKVDFGSQVANLEYSMISNMLGGKASTLSNSPSDTDFDHMGVQTLHFQYMQDANWGMRTLAPVSLPTPSPPAPSPTATDLPSRRRNPETIYATVTQPFPYTAGFHALIAYFKSRFDHEKLLHLARAMAWCRPSFIAVTKNLTEDDLIFMEKCFQRTLLEYEKFIGASGTPSILWRRTGQIAAVGKEFCILTGWSRDRLLGQRTFVMELMDDESVIKYMRDFSKYAFGDSRQGVLGRCNLIRRDGSRLPCGFAWTVKRDVFDIPMMIVGNVGKQGCTS